MKGLLLAVIIIPVGSVVLVNVVMYTVLFWKLHKMDYRGGPI